MVSKTGARGVLIGLSLARAFERLSTDWDVLASAPFDGTVCFSVSKSLAAASAMLDGMRGIAFTTDAKAVAIRHMKANFVMLLEIGMKVQPGIGGREFRSSEAAFNLKVSCQRLRCCKDSRRRDKTDNH